MGVCENSRSTRLPSPSRVPEPEPRIPLASQPPSAVPDAARGAAFGRHPRRRSGVQDVARRRIFHCPRHPESRIPGAVVRGHECLAFPNPESQIPPLTPRPRFSILQPPPAVDANFARSIQGFAGGCGQATESNNIVFCRSGIDRRRSRAAARRKFERVRPGMSHGVGILIAEPAGGDMLKCPITP